jgi:threonyl-tRNA synthetase
MNKKKNLELYRHSAAHLLAHALQRLFPGTLFGIGPATKDGFFYDVVKKDGNFKQDDLVVIAEEMRKIVKENLKIEHYTVSKNEGKEIFSHNPFKLDIINNQITEDVVGIAQQGDFIDLCKGGHVETTGELGFFMLTHISGSYWRADKNNHVMQRISGIIFPTQEELDAHIALQHELEKYDHRVIGKQMELFGMHEEGPGFPFFYPKGAAVINALQRYMRSLHVKNKYKEIKTPTLLHNKLWVRSGHYNHYKDNMYFVECDEEEYAVKPMNCPGAFLTYNSRPRSYKELPLRLAEFGHVHRHELSGTLLGLTRVRAFTQDDAHIICLPSQIKDEIKMIFSLIREVMDKAQLKISKVVLSTRPQKAFGSLELWDTAIQNLKDALIEMDQEFAIAEGDGAFYGPKIGVEMEDNFGRIWSCGTIQLDYVQPENFDMVCINEEGKKERVVVIHQAIFGSLERFFAISLEHHRGKLPFWMAPIQIQIIGMSVDQIEYCRSIVVALESAGIRVEYDDRATDPLKAQLQKAIIGNVHSTIIIGKKEVESNTFSIRNNYKNTVINNIPLDNLIAVINEIQ